MHNQLFEQIDCSIHRWRNNEKIKNVKIINNKLEIITLHLNLLYVKKQKVNNRYDFVDRNAKA